MSFMNSKNVGVSTNKDLKVIVHRIPFNDCTNANMPNVSLKSKQKGAKQQHSQTPKSNTKVGREDVVQKKGTPKINKTINKYEHNINKNCSNSEKLIHLERSSLSPSKAIAKEVEHNIASKQIRSVRQSTPLVKRLRKGNVKQYLEESLDDSVKRSDIQSTSNKSHSFTKIPIYKQPVLLKTKKNLKDPYALDIIDDEEIQHKNKKKLNDSAKFNRTMHDIMMNIEKKEKKFKKKEKSSPVYQNNITKVLNRVLTKINQRKGCSPQKNQKEKFKEKLRKQEHQNLLVKEKLNNTSYNSDEDFLGFDNTSRAQNSMNISNNTLVEERVNSVNKHHEVQLNTSTQSDFEISLENIPSTLKSTPRINILYNIHLDNTRKSTQINRTSSNISLNNRRSETVTSDHHRNLTSLEAHPVEKSHNLLREFQDVIPVLSDTSIASHHTYNEEEYEHVDHDFDDSYHDVSENEDDMYFGFQEHTEPIPEKRFSNKKKMQPWRFQGYFRRNPHLLKIKKNGLPCLQQEMVIDYEFVKRIEALSSNKSVEPPPAKPHVQTTMLDYVESSHDHPEPFRPSSLFDYEEFNVAKPPRRVLGVIHENQQTVSTPKRGVQAIVTSPNVSIIPKEGDEENSPLGNDKPLQRSYQRKVLRDKEAEKDKDILDEDMLPSILDEDYEEEQGEVNLFEDVDVKENPDFSITLPNFKYERKRRKKRQLSEGYDIDEEKKSKKKKKNMMTKAEEAEFEAWAAKTNARFAEEDKHELTIE